tara:strand:+ start:333 stop:695 length:363 start_codon:yes stop_codon:yes gene_type:complete
MPMIKLDELNADKAYQLMEKASNKWSECEEKEIILEEGKKAILGNLINQEQANSVDKLTDKKADNKARNNPDYKNIVNQYASAVKEKLKAKMHYFNLERYSSMRQTELNIQTKLAGKQGG